MNVQGGEIKIFTGNSNHQLAQAIAKTLGLPLGKCEVVAFSDGETSVSVLETVRGCDVYVVQSTNHPVNDHLMELLILTDAFKRASAGRITAVIPYYGYARQDRKSKARDPITAKLVADLIAAAGADRILTMDLHAPQIQGFFNIPVDHMVGFPILAPYFEKLIAQKKISKENTVVMSPDLGSVNRARQYAERLNTPLAIVDKRRPKPNMSEITNIVGEIEGKDILLVDDMVDTAGTLCNAANEIKKRGAKSVRACATHAILSGPALQRLAESALEEVIFLDTAYLPPDKMLPKFKLLSCASVMAQAIDRIHNNKPVSTLFR